MQLHKLKSTTHADILSIARTLGHNTAISQKTTTCSCRHMQAPHWIYLLDCTRLICPLKLLFQGAFNGQLLLLHGLADDLVPQCASDFAIFLWLSMFVSRMLTLWVVGTLRRQWKPPCSDTIETEGTGAGEGQSLTKHQQMPWDSHDCHPFPSFLQVCAQHIILWFWYIYIHIHIISYMYYVEW